MRWPWASRAGRRYRGAQGPRGSALGYAMDGFDLLILGFMLRVISADLQLTPRRAPAGHRDPGRRGCRRRPFRDVVRPARPGACPDLDDRAVLGVHRALRAGPGILGSFDLSHCRWRRTWRRVWHWDGAGGGAWPASKRARASSYVGLGWQLGVLAAAIVTPLLLPVIGWRGMFAVGIFPAVAAYFIRSKLHEPEIFVANKARTRMPPSRCAGSSPTRRRRRPASAWSFSARCRISAITAS